MRLKNRLERFARNDIHGFLSALERGYRATECAEWIKSAADAAGLDSLRKTAGACSAFSNLGAVVLERAMSDWPGYRSRLLIEMVQDARHYSITPHLVVRAGTVGDYPVWWYGGHDYVQAPVPEHVVLASAVRSLRRAKVAPRPGESSMQLLADDRALPAVEIPAVPDLAQKLLATMPYAARSALLYGPPGSGKSIAARQVARQIGESWLALSPEFHASPEVWSLVRVLAPDVLILDDVDARALLSGGDSATMLAQIEAVRDCVRVILLTANTLESLRGAFLRPGRVDEDPVFVGTPTRDVVAEIVGLDKNERVPPWSYQRLAELSATLPPDVARAVVDAAVAAELLPAYVNELRIRALAGRSVDVEAEALAKRMREVGDR